MNTIYLYDISAMIKSGTYSSTGKEWGKPRKDFNFFSFPTGGLYSFNSWFITDLKNSKPGDIFVACFDGAYNKYYRKQAYPEYKANRKIKGYDDNTTVDKRDQEQVKALIDSLSAKEQDEVIRRAAAGIQLKFLRTILPKIGVNVLYEPEMEADDWIYSICYLAGQNYKIMLRADDSDLDDCIQYAPNLMKWSVSGRKKLYPEVGKNFYKIFHGEQKDNIPNLRVNCDTRNMDALRDAIINGLEDVSVFQNDERLMNVYHLLEDEVRALKMNVFLTTPIFRTEISLNNDPIDVSQLVVYLSSLRFKNSLDRIKSGIVETEEVTNMQKFAFSLLPDYVKEFYKRKEFTDSTVDRTILDMASKNQSNTEEYLLEAATKYNII